MKTKLKIVILTICMAVLIASGFAIHSTLAYLSNETETVNKFTIGNVTAEIIETFNPVTLQTGINSYVKKVQVRNSGTVPAYGRVYLGFSDLDVEGISTLSCDGGSTWHTLSYIKEHPPTGWVYKSSGALSGYFYYKNPIKPDGVTPVLITNVKTEFINKTADTNQTINKTVRNYDVLVYAETVQRAKLNGSGLNSSYETAWTEFLGKK